MVGSKSEAYRATWYSGDYASLIRPTSYHWANDGKSMPKYSIGRFEFKTKGAGFDEVRRIKNDTVGLHEPLTGVDLELILALLDQHDDAASGRFKDVKHIAVKEDVQEGRSVAQRAFYVERHDGMQDTFSISPNWYKGLSEERRLRVAIGGCCNLAIRDITLDRKQSAFPNGLHSVAKCEATGVTLGWHDAHVDHSGEWPMVRIIDAWLDSKEPLSWDLLTPQNPPALGWRLTNEFVADFVKFHNERAVLQVIDKTHNLSKGSGGYRRNPL